MAFYNINNHNCTGRKKERALTIKQIAVLEFIKNNLRIPPFAVIMKEFDITKKGVSDHILALQKKGYLESCGNGSRKLTGKK